MNKEIKFRIKDYTGGMGYNWRYLTIKEIIESCELCLDDLDFKSLTQFSGLFDKNGAEIYEGDILKGAGIDGKIAIWRAERLYYFHHWQETEDLIEENGDIEVIGNIYENSELIQTNKNTQ